MNETPDMHERCLLGVVEAGRVLGVGRSTVYSLLAEGSLHPVKLGTRTLIAVDEVRAFARRLAAEAGARFDPGGARK